MTIENDNIWSHPVDVVQSEHLEKTVTRYSLVDVQINSVNSSYIFFEATRAIHCINDHYKYTSCKIRIRNPTTLRIQLRGRVCSAATRA